MSSLSYDLTLAGLSVGGAAALTGIGLIVTYRATGVLNFAHGATAMVCAYVLRQLTVDWHWPLAPAAAVTLLLVAPGIGLLLDRAVFRPLAVLGGDPAQTLVASIGVFVLLAGGAALVWGPGARDDAPTLLSADPWAPLGAAVALAAAVGAVTRWTRFGRELRAVVDDRSLAVLFGIDAGRVAAAGWAFGSFTAGLTGVLLAPSVRLDPYGMPLLVMEVMAVAVAARMRSLPTAVAVALVLGVAQSQLTRLHPSGPREQLIQTAGANLFVIALLAAALVLPGIGSKDALPRTASARVPAPPGAWTVAALLFLIPLGFAGRDLTTSVQVPALAVILLSLVVVTGRGGQISLGQAAYAGLGALFTALLTAGRFPGLPELPHLPALAVAVLLVAPLGLLTGRPAISRHGLALALVTFAFGVGVSRFVFAQPYATAGLTLDRPAGFVSDRAYYTLELALLAGALLLVTALRRGRTGRALAALRDHEAGAAAAGAAVGTLKLTAFVTGAALAALGGGMLAMGRQAFDPAAFDPVRGLLWFAAVLVLGSDSLLGALAAAALLVGLDAGTRGGMAAAVIGVLAVLIGRFPGGPFEALRKAADRLHRDGGPRLTPRGEAAHEALRPARRTPPAGRRPQLRPEGTRGRPGAQRRKPSGGAEAAARPHRDGEHADIPAVPPPRRGDGARTGGDGALTAHHITLAYGDHTALDDVTLTVPPGRITALTGENGAGKSTLFHCLAGTLRPDEGRVTLHGRDITGLPAHARTRAGTARTFQQPAVFSSLTITENIQVAADHSPRGTHGTTHQALRLLDLTRHRTSPAADLPTGVLRRTELARALASTPHTLLLDEPAAGLDTAEVAALATLLRTLAADGMAVLVVEHDLAWLAGLADTVHVMRAGRVVASGPAGTLLNAREPRRPHDGTAR